MTDDQALGQCFMLGWVGAEPSPEIMQWIRERQIGGVKIFGWNTANTTLLARTVGKLQEASLQGPYKIPLFVATDQEGGAVRHIKGDTSDTPGNMAIGASGYPEDAYLSGFYIGREMRILGVNMNFAPSIDLFTDHKSIIIGPRSFGEEPLKVGIMGTAFIRGLEANGVIATAKHFPGHGDTDIDSHGALPFIRVDFDTLWSRELVPFRMLTKEGVQTIMSGFLAFPKTKAGRTPASLSPWFLGNVLQGQIGFKGLLVTDDLMMNGATMGAGSVSNAAYQAILAGNDILMLSKTPFMNDSVWTRLEQAMRSDPSFRAKVREAAARILKTKLENLKVVDGSSLGAQGLNSRGVSPVPFVPDMAALPTGLPDPQAGPFFLDLAARSVTLLQNKGGLLPLDSAKVGKVMLAGRDYPQYFSSGKKAFPDAQNYWFSEERGVKDMLYFAQRADTIIFNVAGDNGPADLAMLAQLKPLQKEGKRIIVFSVLGPPDESKIAWTDAVIATYSSSEESFIAGFSAILGRMPFMGVAPWTAKAALAKDK
jgi:beta-N-acetylhexosaminidase